MRAAGIMALIVLAAGSGLAAEAASPARAPDAPISAPEIGASLRDAVGRDAARQDAVAQDTVDPDAIDPDAAPQTGAADASPPAPSPMAAELMDWVIATGDNAGRPFALVDKVEAKVFVFGADGRLRGWTPALIGLAPGDGSVPGIGDRAMSDIRPEERTTPAGRFVAGYGPAADGKTVLWVDYDDAISLHPVVTSNPREHRLRRLASADPAAHRITYGCINVPADFYARIVRPAFAETKGVVYILPDTRPLDDVFPGILEASARPPPLALAGAGPPAKTDMPNLHPEPKPEPPAQ